MLEDKDLKFASWQLEDGVGASAGFGTVGGGATATKRKRNHQETVLPDIQQLTKKLSDSADGIRTDTEWVIIRLFSPSPTMSDISGTAVAVGTSTESYTLWNYNSAKEDKLIVEWKIMCIEKTNGQSENLVEV